MFVSNELVLLIIFGSHCALFEWCMLCRVFQISHLLSAAM